MAEQATVYDLNDHQLKNLKEAAEHLQEAVAHLMWAKQYDIAIKLGPVADSLISLLSVKEKPKWVDIPVPAGKPRHGQKLDPMPPGPYLVTDQFDNRDFEGMDVADVIREHLDLLRNEAPNALGSVGYHFNSEHKLSKCFFFYDTSD